MYRTWIRPKAHLIQRKEYGRGWGGGGQFEDKCCVVTHCAADIRVAWLVYLACLRSHVLRAYCNFESKQANSITL